MRLSERFIKANDLVCAFENHVPSPYFRKTFELDFKPERAEITICGLGFYELYINGENITKGPLAPYIINTDELCYYDNYEITELLKEGKNVIAIQLGNGFRNPFGGFIWNFDEAAHIGPVTTAFCLEARDSKNEIVIEADESVKTHPSPITFNDIRMGCRYDARLEIPRWNEIDFDDSKWDNALKEATPRGEKVLCPVEPITVTREIKPVNIEHYDELPFCHKTNDINAEPRENTFRKDVYVFDFGTNTTGVAKLKINGYEGQKIIIRKGEMLIDGKFTISNIIFNAREGKDLERYLDYSQTDVYICKGGKEEFIPKFKFDGFQYAYVEGLKPEQVSEDTLTLVEMYSKLNARGDFECSDDVLNTLQRRVRRSDLTNIFYFPMDCPHREKNGWTGDAAVSAEHMLLNITVEQYFKEWLRSIRCAQTAEGVIPGIVPTGGWGFEWGNGPAWDRVLVELPYQVYRFTGDKSVITENADAIVRYLNYIASRRDERGLIAVGLGDWLDPNWNEYDENSKIASPLEFTDSVIVMNICEKVIHLFNQADITDGIETAQKLGNEMRESIRENLIDKATMTVAGNCQTSQAVALSYGVFYEDELPKAQAKLIEIIRRDGDVNACGKIGVREIFHVLTQMGEVDLAVKIIKSEHPHCYGYWVKNGGDTMWESFKALDNPHLDSRNHHFLGDISNLFIQEFAGLKPNPDAIDVSHFEVSPIPPAELDYAKAYYDYKTGRINVEWKREGEGITLNVKTAPETYGEIKAPAGYAFADGNDIVEWQGEKEFNLQMKKA